MKKEVTTFKEKAIKNHRKYLASLKESTEPLTFEQIQEQDDRATELYLEERRLKNDMDK